MASRWLLALYLLPRSLSSMGQFPLYRSLFGRIVDSSMNLIEEVKYRKYRLDQYRNFVLTKFKKSYNLFINVNDFLTSDSLYSQLEEL